MLLTLIEKVRPKNVHRLFKDDDFPLHRALPESIKNNPNYEVSSDEQIADDSEKKVTVVQGSFLASDTEQGTQTHPFEGEGMLTDNSLHMEVGSIVNLHGVEDMRAVDRKSTAIRKRTRTEAKWRRELPGQVEYHSDDSN